MISVDKKALKPVPDLNSITLLRTKCLLTLVTDAPVSCYSNRMHQYCAILSRGNSYEIHTYLFYLEILSVKHDFFLQTNGFTLACKVASWTIDGATREVPFSA